MATTREMTKTKKHYQRPTKHVRLSPAVIKALSERREGYETPDATLRRLLQLPPRKAAA